MGSTDIEPTEITKFDPGLTERVMGLLKPFLKGYHRAEVRGLDTFPAGGALVVSNHSGGLFAMDVPVFASGFYEKFGFDRPVYTLSHDLLMTGPQGVFLKKTGFIPANHRNADEALRSGGVVVVFPGGDYDVYRPTLSANKIDFGGRTGYVKAALNAGVPIVPTVGIGAGHREASADYRTPYQALVDYLDVLAAEGVPQEQTVLAALTATEVLSSGG